MSKSRSYYTRDLSREINKGTRIGCVSVAGGGCLVLLFAILVNIIGYGLLIYAIMTLIDIVFYDIPGWSPSNPFMRG